MLKKNIFGIKNPTVYFENISSLPPSVAQVETAIPAFIGYTQLARDVYGNDLTDQPIVINSMKDYESLFGFADNEKGIEVKIVSATENGNIIIKSSEAYFNRGHKPSMHNMYYALRLFFDNGGGKSVIISIGKTGSESIIDQAKLKRGLDALALVDEPTLIVFPEGQGIDNSVDYYSLIESAINQCSELRDRFCIIDIYKQESTTTETITNFRAGLTGNENFSFGAAYYPNLKTTYNYQYDEAEIIVNIKSDNAAAVTKTLKDLKGNSISNKTDSVNYTAALNAINELHPILPPSCAVAGIYAQVDSTRGVWKAPANVSISSVYETTDTISDAEQGDMNVDPGSGKSVNAIRVFSGKGILVWGARTLAGNDNEWRYISVRRLFIMVEESCKKATLPFVFEPNDGNTWVKVRSMLENYLAVLWRQGALEGTKPENAFFVKCGLGSTMTPQDILEGRLIIEIGMAPLRPAEFITLRITHKIQNSKPTSA